MCDYQGLTPENVREFHLPRFKEIPGIGLYLEQVTKLIGDALLPIGDDIVTASMLSNYVKKKLVDSPVKKQYSRELIARLMFISVAKSVMTLEQIGTILKMQKDQYTDERAYNYFCDEFEVMLVHVFTADTLPVTADPQMPVLKRLLQNAICAAAYRIYLNGFFRVLDQKKDE